MIYLILIDILSEYPVAQKNIKNISLLFLSAFSAPSAVQKKTVLYVTRTLSRWVQINIRWVGRVLPRRAGLYHGF